MIIYGIKNCDTVKKALAWLNQQGIDHQFHDFRKDGLDENMLRTWVKELGWETLLNRRGTTWRTLPETAKEHLDDARATALMMTHPAIIKRPVLDLGVSRHVGFSTASYSALFSKFSKQSRG